MLPPLALLFPGQGSQAVGMGKALCDRVPAARATFATASEVLGFDLMRLCFDGPEEELRRTAVTQPAILTHSVAMYRLAAPRGLKVAVAAGHSLGEYSALVAAGALDFAAAVRLVHLRGRFMQEAVPEGEGAMAAVLGLDPERVEEVCRDTAARHGVVEAANYNSREQVVLAGSAAAVAAAAALAKERGAKRVVMLPVSAPFHCSLMRPAMERLVPELDAVEFRDPAWPVVVNVSAQPLAAAAEVRQALKEQVCAAVRWDASLRRILADGVNTFLELGPGSVLTQLVRRLDRALRCQAAGDPEGLERALAALQG